MNYLGGKTTSLKEKNIKSLFCIVNNTYKTLYAYRQP